MYEFWYDYIRPKYQDKAKLYYMNTDIANDVDKWFDTSNYSENDKKPFLICKNEKVTRLFKDELGGKIMQEFVGLRARTYGYLMDDDSEHKKTEGTKKCVTKRRIRFENYKDCLFNNKIIFTLQRRFKSDYHNI